MWAVENYANYAKMQKNAKLLRITLIICQQLFVIFRFLSVQEIEINIYLHEAATTRCMKLMYHCTNGE